MHRKCLRCAADSGKELYCSLCAKGDCPSYIVSKREKEWQKRLFKKLEKIIEEADFNPSRRESKHE